MTRHGVTLIEVLITLVIGSIAMFALAAPFVAERSFWGTGQRQTEAQRDAQLALRAIARAIREGSTPSLAPGNPPDATLTFNVPCGAGVANVTFSGGPSFGGQLQMIDSCSGVTSTLIDGVRSRVTDLLFTGVSTKLVRVQIDVTHQNQEHEFLVTELFLRNAP